MLFWFPPPPVTNPMSHIRGRKNAENCPGLAGPAHSALVHYWAQFHAELWPGLGREVLLFSNPSFTGEPPHCGGKSPEDGTPGHAAAAIEGLSVCCFAPTLPLDYCCCCGGGASRRRLFVSPSSEGKLGPIPPPYYGGLVVGGQTGTFLGNLLSNFLLQKLSTTAGAAVAAALPT